MSLWKRLFSRESAGDAEGRVSAEAVADLIKKKVSGFQHSKGMVVVNQDGCVLTIHFFDGIAKCTWNYFNGQLSVDRVGDSFLEKPPTQVVLQVNQDLKFKATMERAFRGHDISVQMRNKYDCSVRISLEASH